MKALVSLMVELRQLPNTFQSFHYAGERHAIDWFKMPINFPSAVNVLEAHKFQNIKTVTVEEIALASCECWTIVFFNNDDEFVRTMTYKLT